MSIQFSQLPEDKPEKEAPLSLVKDNADSITARQEFSVVSNPQNDSAKDDRLAKMGGAATLDMMNFYGTAPSTGLDSEDDASASRSNFIQRQPGVGEWTIGNGVGSLANKTAEERQQEKDEKASEQLAEVFTDIEENRRQREQEEWLSKKSIEVGNGITMSAEEIDTLLSVLGTEAGRKKFADAYKKKTGSTDEQAKKAAEDTERYFRILKQKETGKDVSQNDANFLKTFPTTQEGKASIRIAAELEKSSRENGLSSDVTPNRTSVKSQDMNSYDATVFTKAKESGGIQTSVHLRANWDSAQTAMTPLDAPIIEQAKQMKIAITSPALANNMSEA